MTALYQRRLNCQLAGYHCLWGVARKNLHSLEYIISQVSIAAIHIPPAEQAHSALPDCGMVQAIRIRSVCSCRMAADVWLYSRSPADGGASCGVSMRILVTGAAGFIGSNLVKSLSAAGHTVVGVDDFSSASWRNLTNFAGDLVTADVSSELAGLSRIGRCDVIFHQASITDTTVHDQRRMMVNNMEGFRQILDLAMSWGSRVIWASSASIYGNNPAPNSENQPPAPLNVYAFSKMKMEHLADSYRDRLVQPIIGLRYFNVYGPGEDHKGKFASMIHQLAKQMLSGKRPRIFKWGEQKRDFVYIEDVVQANLKAMTCPRGGVFNVGCGRPRSFNEIIANLNRVLGTNLEPDYFDNPYSFTQDLTQADLTNSRAVLKYEPKYQLEEGIDAYFASGKLGKEG